MFLYLLPSLFGVRHCLIVSSLSTKPSSLRPISAFRTDQYSIRALSSIPVRMTPAKNRANVYSINGVDDLVPKEARTATAPPPLVRKFVLVILLSSYATKDIVFSP